MRLIDPTSFLFRPGPLELLGWQWLALPVAFLAAWLLGSLLSRVTRALLGRAARRTATTWDDAMLARMGSPLTVGWAIGVSRAVLALWRLPDQATALFQRWLAASALVVFFWALARAVDVARQNLADSHWIRQRPATRSLLQLGAKVAQLFLLAIGVVALLSELGYPVASLVAGLGIGGLAVALAAQKTLENLFGALAIGADQILREGDFVRVDDVLGTVETIGLRSTRIRTAERTLISIPNGKLAEMRIESFAVRDRLRLACTLPVVYGTTSEQLGQLLAALEQVLREHPKLWPEGVTVRLKELGSSSLDIEINAWFQTQDWDEFMLIREQTFLRFLSAVERAGTSLAFPTRSVHLVRDKASRRPANDAEL